MQIIKADILGFCFGVRRAVELADKAINENPEKKIYSLGPLIHNESVLADFEKRGLVKINQDNLDFLDENSVVIIRAHGTSPDVLAFLEKKGCKIIDATCPRVKNSQTIVEESSKNKDYIIFTGDKNHGEVKSIEGYGSKNFVLLQDVAETEFFCTFAPKNSSVLLLSQTTFSSKEFSKIVEIIKNKYPDAEVKNTICPATRERQESLINLCENVEGVLVIGGRTSANTARLFQIALDNCNKAAFIQNEKDIPQDFLKLNKIGITAGASTPDTIISSVENFLLKAGND